MVVILADQGCVSGSLSEAALVTKGKLLHDPPLLVSSSVEHNAQQRVYPGISFNCSGKITGIVFAALEGSLAALEYPEVQLWRKGSSLYTKVANISLAGSTRADSLNLYHVTLNDPVLFERGDGLGLYVPPRERSRLVIQFQEAAEAGVLVMSYSSSEFSSGDSIFNISDSGVLQDEDIPMMIIESGE